MIKITKPPITKSISKVEEGNENRKWDTSMEALMKN